MSYLFSVAFDGTNYFGTQAQVDKPTISKKLNEALLNLQIDGKLKYFSRLDSGVHSYDFPALLMLNRSFKGDLKVAFNAYLPNDIRIRSVTEVDDKVDLKRLIKSKTYRYYFYLSKDINPLVDRFAVRISPIDISEIDQVIDLFIGSHDFASFRTTGSNVKTSTRTINSFKLVKKTDNFYYFEINGDGFLKNQIRLIIGTIFKYLHHKIDLETIRNMLISKSDDSSLVGHMMPARGLVLFKIFLNLSKI